MTDPTPHARRSPMEHERDATPADELVERVAQIICDHEKCHVFTGRIWGEVLPRHTDLARAVVALALGEAARARRRRRQ